MSNEIVKVECRGGIIVEARVENLKRVSKYFEYLLSDRWTRDKNVPLKLREVSSTFLIEQLESLEDDCNPYEFLNLPDPTKEEEEEPPTPSYLESERIEIELNQAIPKSCDTYSHFMIHIDRKLFSTPTITPWWNTKMICINMQAIEIYVTFNEAWIMALTFLPNKIKIYHDRIDMPLFPDFVFLSVAAYDAAPITFTSGFGKYIHITSQKSFFETSLRRNLLQDQQILPLTMPSRSDNSECYFVSGDGLKISDITCYMPKEMYTITPFDEHQFINPFGGTVKTFVVKNVLVDTIEDFRNLFITPPILTFKLAEMQRNRTKLARDGIRISSSTTIVWTLKDLKVYYLAGLMGIRYILD